eukprot:PhM_4_TR16124/c0_g1_i1/m.26871
MNDSAEFATPIQSPPRSPVRKLQEVEGQQKPQTTQSNTDDCYSPASSTDDGASNQGDRSMTFQTECVDFLDAMSALEGDDDEAANKQSKMAPPAAVAGTVSVVTTNDRLMNEERPQHIHDVHHGATFRGVGGITVATTPTRYYVVPMNPRETLFVEECAHDLRRLAKFVLVLCVVWFVLWVATGKSPAEPRGALFDTFSTVIIATVVGQTTCRYLTLPPLIGILAIGVLYAALPGDYTSGIPGKVLAATRSVGSAVILLRAGLAINVAALRKVVFSSLLLAITPLVVESVCHVLMSQYAVEFDGSLSWSESWLLAFMMCGVSPAIAVPALMQLQDVQKKGVHSGLVTFMLSAVGINVALAFVLFNIVFVADFGGNDSTSSSVSYALIPIQIVGGGLLGVVVALVLARLFGRVPSSSNRMLLAFLVNSVGMCMTFAGSEFDLQGGSVVAVFVFAVMFNAVMRKAQLNEQRKIDHETESRAKLGLTKNSSHRPKNVTNTAGENMSFVKVTTTMLWEWIVQPFLFGLVGASLRRQNRRNGTDDDGIGGLSVLFDTTNFPRILILFVVAASAAACATFCMFYLLTYRRVSTRRWTLGELGFVVVTWIGKGTPQVALGGLLLAHQEEEQDAEGRNTSKTESGLLVLQASVLSVLILGPLGAALVRILGPKLVKRE